MRRHGILLVLLSIRLLPGLQPGGGYLRETGCTRWGMPDSLVSGTVSYYHNSRIFGNRFVSSALLGHRSVCLGLPSKVNESIDCQPLTIIRDCLINWGPCVVRGPVDGRFLVWWVIDNVVWTGSWLSIAGAGCGLTDVSAGEEQERKGIVSEASRCGEDK
jgi:hypothetical protein